MQADNSVGRERPRRPHCGTSGSQIDGNTMATLGANGILGVSNFPQDCGAACTSAANGIPMYYLCTQWDLRDCFRGVADQLWNPVTLFAQDNNGVLLSLPSMSASGQATVSGSMIFGVVDSAERSLRHCHSAAI